jgi:hypothetical protein
MTVNLTAASAAPSRPSFQVTDGAGTPLLADANVTFGGAGTAALHIAPALILSNRLAPLHGDTSTSFVFACDGTQTPVASSLSIELLKMSDAAGMTPDLDAQGRGTVVPAAVDQAQFTAGSCGAAPAIPWTAPLQITLQNGSAKVNLLDPSVPPVPGGLVPGRYAVVVTSLAKQVWRVPNEWQPMLQDPGAYAVAPSDLKTLLQSQQAAVNIAP